VEGLVMTGFFSGKQVFITGHTGFKGGWLSLWLTSLGARVSGYSLAPPTNPSIFELARIREMLVSHVADIRDVERLTSALAQSKAEIVFHLAAQSLVRDSYKSPVDTYSTNVMGTVNLLEAVRSCPSVKAVVNITTDKCYENREWDRGYREDDRLGGYDPYSNSKACSELVTAAYRSSYFNRDAYLKHGVAIATARAGNVIGGGDWATDRLVPDSIRALLAGEAIRIRNPHAVRPWQHVLEPLSGYLALAQRLYQDGPEFAEAWNFGPEEGDARPVEWIVQRICQLWGEGARYEKDNVEHPHEAQQLTLDCSKTRARIGWKPRWRLENSLGSIIDWTRHYRSGSDMRDVCLRQVDDYTRDFQATTEGL
jgi:CDP-glucose 4,6-dehydratase